MDIAYETDLLPGQRVNLKLIVITPVVRCGVVYNLSFLVVGDGLETQNRGAQFYFQLVYISGVRPLRADDGTCARGP